MCVGDVMLWHVANVGMQSDFLSVYFTGNPFEKEKSYGTVLTLFPMMGDTVTTEMETEGKWSPVGFTCRGSLITQDAIPGEKQTLFSSVFTYFDLLTTFLFEGEWEISAFDPVLKMRGMSVRYSVFNCERVLPLADNEDYEYDFEDYVERKFPAPRGFGEKNRTVAVRVCKKVSGDETRNDSRPEEMRNKVVCKTKLIPVEETKDLTRLSPGGIPQDVLDQLDNEISQNSINRQKRETWEQNSVQSDPESRNTTMTGTKDEMVEEPVRNLDVGRTRNGFVDPFRKFLHRLNLSEPLNLTSNENIKANVTNRVQRNTWSIKTDPFGKPNVPLSDNDIVQDLHPDTPLQPQDHHKCTHMKDHMSDTNSQHFQLNSSHEQVLVLKPNSTDYDDYGDEANETAAYFDPGEILNIRSSESAFRSYYIAAEEITWNYGMDQLMNSR